MSDQSLQKRQLAYCAASFGFTLLSSTFSFYYVKVFLNLYHIEEGWFHTAQMLYLVWNAVNDPLFAYWQDSRSFWLVRTRREMILYTGPLFGLAYLVAWFPWGGSGWVTGVHLIVSLCLYDTMFTFIGLAMCCLFTEIALSEKDRIRLTCLAKIGSFIGSFSISLCEFTSNSLKNFHSFQLTTICIAVVSSIAMYYCGKHAHTHYDVKNLTKEDSEEEEGEEVKSSFWRLALQIILNRNFLSFVATNFLQEIHRSYLVSFISIICDHLIDDSDVSPGVKSVFYGGMGSLATVVFVLGTPVITKLGYAGVMRSSFLWKIVAGLVLAFVGRGHPWFLILYLLADGTNARLASSMFNLPLSDITDEDRKIHNRRYGYESFKKGTLFGGDVSQLKDVMFQLTWCLPLVVGILQTISWSFYRLRQRTTGAVSV